MMNDYYIVARKVFLKFLDAILILVFVTPLVVAFWSSTWNLSTLVIFPEYPLISPWISICIGFGSSLIARTTFPYINNMCGNDKFRLMTWRFLLYPLSLSSVFCWMGIWTSWNILTGTHLQSNLISVAVGMFILLVSGLFSNAMGAPGSVGRDSFLKPFTFYTRFQHLQNTTVLVKIIDSIFTCLFTGLGVVSFWRGTWQVQDNLLFPDPSDFVLSASVSLGAGYILCIICFCTNTVYKEFTKVQSRIIKYVLEYVWIFFISISANMSWRGIWYLYDVFVFPESMLTRSLLLHGIAVLVLYPCGCLSCVLSPPGIGCSLGVDGQDELHGLIMGTVLPTKSDEFNLNEREENVCPKNVEVINAGIVMDNQSYVPEP